MGEFVVLFSHSKTQYEGTGTRVDLSASWRAFGSGRNQTHHLNHPQVSSCRPTKLVPGARGMGRRLDTCRCTGTTRPRVNQRGACFHHRQPKMRVLPTVSLVAQVSSIAPHGVFKRQQPVLASSNGMVMAENVLRETRNLDHRTSYALLSHTASETGLRGG